MLCRLDDGPVLGSIPSSVLCSSMFAATKSPVRIFGSNTSVNVHHKFEARRHSAIGSSAWACTGSAKIMNNIGVRPVVQLPNSVSDGNLYAHSTLAAFPKFSPHPLKEGGGTSQIPKKYVP